VDDPCRGPTTSRRRRIVRGATGSAAREYGGQVGPRYSELTGIPVTGCCGLASGRLRHPARSDVAWISKAGGSPTMTATSTASPPRDSVRDSPSPSTPGTAPTGSTTGTGVEHPTSGTTAVRRPYCAPAPERGSTPAAGGLVPAGCSAARRVGTRMGMAQGCVNRGVSTRWLLNKLAHASRTRVFICDASAGAERSPHRG